MSWFFLDNIFSTGAVIMVYTLLATYKMVDASRKLHNAMLDNVMRAPMSFFDTTPTGRIVNRFSRDVETTDSTLPMVLRMWLNMFFSTLSTFAVISYSTPLFLTVIIPVLIFYVLVQVCMFNYLIKKVLLHVIWHPFVGHFVTL